MSRVAYGGQPNHSLTGREKGFYSSYTSDILKMFQRKYKHKLKPLKVDSLRWYQRNMLQQGSIIEQKFCYLDASGTLRALKELITTDFIS